MKTQLLQVGLAFILGALFTASLAGAADEEDGVIKIRLSYKIIINPKNCARPNPTRQIGEELTDEMIADAVHEMNELLTASWRGYRFELHEIIEVGSLGGNYPDPSHWFDIDFVDDDKKNEIMSAMEKNIAAHSAKYAWRENAVNIYINQTTSGAKWKLRDLIVVGADSVSAGWVQLHEIGHYFDLRHTHGVYNADRPGKNGEGQKIPGDDKVDDTVKDLPNWDRNEIAQHNFSLTYDQLDPAQKALVDEVAENIMSYHFLKPIQAAPKRLTEGQMDRWTDTTLDFYRLKVRDGRTWFIDRKTPGPEGTSTYPYVSVNLAVKAANGNGGDIILLRPGVYDEAVTISKPVTLRATRKGPASIGTSIAPAEFSAE